MEGQFPGRCAHVYPYDGVIALRTRPAHRPTVDRDRIDAVAQEGMLEVWLRSRARRPCGKIRVMAGRSEASACIHLLFFSQLACPLRIEVGFFAGFGGQSPASNDDARSETESIALRAVHEADHIPWRSRGETSESAGSTEYSCELCKRILLRH